MKQVKNKNNRLLVNIISYALLQITNILVGLVLPRLYLKTYGSEVNGIISTVNSFTTYFSYLEAGLGLTLIHSLFKPLSTNDYREINGILTYSKKQYKKISLIYFVLIICLSLIFPFIKLSNDLSTFEFVCLVFVIGLYGAVDFYTMSKYRVLLTADRKEYVISFASIIAQLLRFIFVWLLLKIKLSVVYVKIVPILTLVVRSLILKVYITKKYPNASYNENTISSVETTSNRWDALLLQISISTSTALPILLVSQFLGYKEANVYAIYSLVASILISIVSAMSSGVSPLFGKRIVEGKDVTSYYNYYDYIVTCIITLIFSVTVVMFIPFIKIYTKGIDDINYIRPIYALLITIWAALYSYRIPVTAVINAAGVYKENRINNLINLIGQIVLGIIFTAIFGVTGLLITMIIFAIQRNISLTVINSKKRLSNGVLISILRQIIIVIMILLNYLIFYKLIIEKLEINIFLWVLIAILAFFVNLLIIVLFAIVFNKKLFKKNLNLRL